MATTHSGKLIQLSHILLLSYLLPLMLVFLISACSDGGSSSGVGEETSEPPVRDFLQDSTDQLNQIPVANAQLLTGEVTFDRVPVSVNGLDYADTQRVPSKLVLVQAVDESGDVVASDLTDENGFYELSVPQTTPLAVRIVAQMDVTSLWRSANPSNENRRWVLVEDNTSDFSRYAIQGAFATWQESSERFLHASSGWTGSGYGAARNAAPFAILDTLFKAFQILGEINAPLDNSPFRVRWSVNNRPVDEGSVNEGDIGTSHYSSQARSFFLLGAENSDTDEYDEHLILHEFAHCLEDRTGRLDSLGGKHGVSESLDFRLAFSEGWATAFSSLILEEPLYLDSQGLQQARVGGINVETQHVGVAGWFNESSVQSLLYDIGDSDQRDDDELSLGLTALLQSYWKTSRNLAPMVGAHPVLFNLKQDHPSQRVALDQLYGNFEITADDLWGDSESNNGGLSNSLPIYDTLTPLDVRRSCFTLQGVPTNKLGNRRLFRTSAPFPSAFEWRVQLVSGSAINYSLILWDRGVNVGFSIGQNLRATLVENRDYVLELRPFDEGVDEDTDDAFFGMWCFDVTMIVS